MKILFSVYNIIYFFIDVKHYGKYRHLYQTSFVIFLLEK
jgi:hypothetical protein